jgi:tetratricopeptide (TPR) repeat protein
MSLGQSRTWEPTTRRYRGVALAQLERHEEAIEDLSLAIEHFIVNFRPEYQEQDREAVGYSLLTRAGCHIALKNHEGAGQDLKLAKPFLSGDDLALRRIHLANCHRSSGDVDAAIAEARKAVEIYEECKASPRSLESAYTFLGEHLMTAKRYEDAVATFGQAIDLNRNHAGMNENLDALLLRRVNASLNSRQLDVGFQDIREMLERHPGDKNSRIWRATFSFEAGDYKTAAAEWLDLLQDSPDDESLLINCIGVFAGNPDDDVRDGRKALELAHRLAALHKDPEWRSQGGLAAAQAELGDFENAIAAAERSLELAPDDEKPGRLHRLEAYRNRNGRPFRYETIHRSG